MTDHVRSQLLQVAITAGIVLLMMVFLQVNQIFQSTIIFGQAHFLITYIYQYHAKKINKTYLWSYVLVLTPLLIITYVYDPYTLYTAVVLIYFVAHFLQDEIYIFDGKRTVSMILTVISVFLLYTGLIINDVYGGEILYLFSDIAAVVMVLSFLISWIKREPIQVPQMLFYCIILCLLLFVIREYEPPIKLLLGSITLFHYIRWYLFYFMKVKNDKVKLKVYLQRVAVINVLAVFFYVLFIRVPLLEAPLNYIYGPVYFLMWTIMHITFSVRFGDYKLNTLVKRWMPNV